MKIATFNINGIKARCESLCRWLDDANPDVVLLQELKSIDDGFPSGIFEERGFNVAVHGQKSFNGVAILSKFSLEDITRGLPGNPSDQQARWIEATIVGKKAIRICCLYLPNGNPAPGPKYDYKLQWMDRLYDRALELIKTEEPTLIGGDFNIIPQKEDAATPHIWSDDALFLPESREKFRLVQNLGFSDAFRLITDQPGHYSFWDYQRGAWAKDNGIRIDHFLLSPTCCDLLYDCKIDSLLRGEEKPSDHVPVTIYLDN
tara:strand:+ start:295 stop:1074 length:780 start_codon:yes stop_codon:yes gene_type:complete